MKVRIRLKEGAQMPTKAHLTDAAWDLYAHWIEANSDLYTIGTGVHIEVPVNYVGLIFPRSSVSKMDLRLSNSVGVIDPGYAGEIIVKFDPLKWGRGLPVNLYETGERCAQFLLIKNTDITWNVVDEFDETARGMKGFGSSGK
jgi:dUTP pyrophosphatase